MKQAPRILVIPDVQAKPDVPLEHLSWAGRYAADKRPDAIVCLGDLYDMPSLYSYDRGRLSGEGRRYEDDIMAGNRALEMFNREVRKPRSYKPRLEVTLGNHEDRVSRAVEEDPRLEGKVSENDFAFQKYGWTVNPFLQPVSVMGVTFCHYCPVGPNGRVTNSKRGAPSAKEQARRMMRTTVCGHAQGKDVAEIYTPGRVIRGLIVGSFYQHTESYMYAVGDTYWRGVVMLNEIRDGNFDLCEVSIDYLARKYG